MDREYHATKFTHVCKGIRCGTVYYRIYKTYENNKLEEIKLITNEYEVKILQKFVDAIGTCAAARFWIESTEEER